MEIKIVHYVLGRDFFTSDFKTKNICGVKAVEDDQLCSQSVQSVNTNKPSALGILGYRLRCNKICGRK